MTFVASSTAICTLATAAATDTGGPDEAGRNPTETPARDARADRILRTVTEHVDTLMDKCRDRWGEPSPLFLDSYDIDADGPVPWKINGKQYLVSNFSHQQDLMRTLDNLSKVTGDPRYHDAALKTIRHAMRECGTGNGFFYWGSHMAWDVGKERPVTYPNWPYHEFVSCTPPYGLWYEADPERTVKFIETLWGGHVVDWGKLEFNRHAQATKRHSVNWDAEFDEDLEVPFIAARHTTTYSGQAYSMMSAGAALTRLTGRPEGATWASRLAKRFVQARHEESGLSGTRYSYQKIIPAELDKIRGKEMKSHRGYNSDHAWLEWGDEFGEYLMQHKMILAPRHHRDLIARYQRYPVAQLNIAERGPDEAAAFAEQAVEDLKAFAKHAYDPETHRIYATHKDGSHLPYEKMFADRERHERYTLQRFRPRPVTPWFAWPFARAYEVKQDPALWATLRSMLKGIGMGDIGTPAGEGRALAGKPDCADPFAVAIAAHLYRVTKDTAFLDLGFDLAERMITERYHKGFFVFSPRHYIAKVGANEPAALLQLVAAARGNDDDLWPMTDNVSCLFLPHDDFKSKLDWGRLRENVLYLRTRNTKDMSLAEFVEWIDKQNYTDSPSE